MVSVYFPGTFSLLPAGVRDKNAFGIVSGNNAILWSNYGDTGFLNKGEMRVKYGNVTTEVYI